MQKPEELSHIHEASIDKVKEKADKVKGWVHQTRQYANYIAIGGLIIASLVISMVTVQDGSVAIISFAGFTFFRWLLFFAQVIIPPILAMIIMETFANQGMNYGKAGIRSTIEEYIELEAKHKTQPRPRSEKQYRREQLIKDTSVKFSVIMLFTFLTASVVLSGSINSLVGVLVNILLALMFGFRRMIHAMNYVEEELQLWYKERIAEMKQRDEILKGITITSKEVQIAIANARAAALKLLERGKNGYNQRIQDSSGCLSDSMVHLLVREANQEAAGQQIKGEAQNV